MSHRPEPGLIVCDGIDHLHCGREATSADALAYVRRGVESGEIEGEVVTERQTRVLPIPCLVIPIDGEET